MSVLQKHHCVEFLVRALFFKEKIYFFLKYIHACVGVGVRETEKRKGKKQSLLVLCRQKGPSSPLELELQAVITV